MYPSHRRALGVALFTLGTLFTLAACGGQNSASVTPAVTPTPANSVTFSVAATGGSVTLPTAFGLVGTMTFPAATKGAGTSMTFVENGGSPPSGLPNLNTPNIPVLFFSLADPSDTTFAGFPGLSVTFASGLDISTSTFYLAFYDPKNPTAGWQLNFSGPATVSGQTVTFAATSTPFAMTGGSTYNFAMYAIQGGPTPTPPPHTQFVFESNHAAGAARNTINVFPGNSNGNVIPVSSITDAAGPNGLAASATVLYAANQGASITEYTIGASGSGTPAATITSAALLAPQYIALDASNNIYVTQSTATGGGADNVQVFAAAASGASVPSTTIAGALTGLNGPAGIAVSSGVIYVANTGNNSVTEYATTANGNVAPVATIAGALTNLSGPTGISVDAAGIIYVTNANNSITVFAKGATGNVAPTATITGANTLLAAPAEISVDGTGRAFVANSGGNSLLVFQTTATGNAFPVQTVTGPSTGLASPFGIATR